MANVKFYNVKLQSTYDALVTKEASAIYFVQETSTLYNGDKLFGTGALATEQAAGLLSPEDYVALKELIAGSTTGGNELVVLQPVDGTISITDVDGGKAIGVAIAPDVGNTLVAVEGGLFVPTVTVPEYAIEKQEVASEGFSATYKLKKTVDGVDSYVGDEINIAKDLVLQSATLETVTEDGVPYADAVVGDPYICMVFNDATTSNLYIPVKGLVDTYTSGDGIEIVDNKISIKLADVTHGLVAVDGALMLSLATADNDGAMSKEDKKTFDAIPSVYVAHKYEISSKPEGTLVDYRDKEIRIMCPADTEWELQQSGEGADANSYYIGLKAYAPDDAVSFKEDLAEIIADTEMYYFENNEFAGIDVYGRKYSIVWLPVAYFSDGVWTYYGTSSTTSKYIGWYYTVQWYNSNGKMIAADQIRINLSNEDCYIAVAPSYVNEIITSTEAEEIKTSIAAMEESYSWGEL